MTDRQHILYFNLGLLALVGVLWLAACTPGIAPAVPTATTVVATTAPPPSAAVSASVTIAPTIQPTVTPAPTRTSTLTPTTQTWPTRTPDLTATIVRAATATQTYKGLRRVSYDEKTWTHFEVDNILGNAYEGVYSIAAISADDAWFSSWAGYLLHFDGSRMISYTLPISGSHHVVNFGDLVIDQNQNVWVGAWEDGIFRFDGQNWRHFTTKEGLPEKVDRLLIGPDNTLWAVMRVPGSIYRFNGKTWEFYWSLETAANNTSKRNFPATIMSIQIDPAGKFWITTDYGVSTLDHLEWYKYPWNTFPHFSECASSVVKTSPDGSIWINNCGDPTLIHSIPGKYVKVYGIPELTKQSQIGYIYVAPDNGLWIGTEKDSGVDFMHWDGKAWTIYDGFPRSIYALDAMPIAVTSDGTIWIGTETEIYCYKP